MIKFDKRMMNKNRKVLMFLDNCSSHPPLELNNTQFLPPNTTSKTQPLDSGIIHSFKQRYRNQMLEYIIEILDKDQEKECEFAVKSISLLKAIYMMDSSIKSIPDSVFVNCFKVCGISFEDSITTTIELTEDLYAMNNWNTINGRLNLEFESFDDFVCVDNQVICTEEPNDEEIIDIVKRTAQVTPDITDDENEVIDSDIILKIPTKMEALDHIHNMRLYLGSLPEVDNSFYDLLTKFQNFVLCNRVPEKLSLITDYFSNN